MIGRIPRVSKLVVLIALLSVGACADVESDGPVGEAEQGATASTGIHRMWNGTSKRHRYDTSQLSGTTVEVWNYFHLLTFQAPSTVPLLRCTNTAAGTHDLGLGSCASGFTSAGQLGYAATQQIAGTTPLYRLRNASGDFFHTTSWPEAQTAQANGYAYKGINGYVFTAPSNAPEGYLDRVNPDGTIEGWGLDIDTPSQSVNVHLYIDGAFVSQIPTNVLRTDVNAARGVSGNHGFKGSIPRWFWDGAQHTMEIYVLDTSGLGPNPPVGLGNATVSKSFVLNAPVAPVSLTKPLESSLFLAPKTYNGQFYGIVGNISQVPNPAWHVAQWNIPAELTPTSGPASGWMTANSYARVQYMASETSGTNVYDLGSNGNTSALPCGTEMDLFLETGDPGTYPNRPDGFTSSAPLDQLYTVKLNAGLKIAYEQLNARCSLNYVGYIASVILGNTASGQTLFYQIDFRDSRNIVSSMQWCPDYEYGNNGLYCLDDHISVLGGTTVQANNTRVNNSVNLLSRLRKIITSNHAKAGYPSQRIDPDMSHWKIEEVYFGHVLQGGMIATSRWYDMSITAQ